MSSPRVSPHVTIGATMSIMSPRHRNKEKEEVITAKHFGIDDDLASQPPKNIFEAAERGQVSYIVRQVERSLEFDINQRDRIQRTALHWAAELNQIEAAEALLDYSCDVTATECNGRTAMHLAAREGHAAMLRLLMEGLDAKQKEAQANRPDNFGITPVYLSLQKGEDSRGAFEYLMRCGGRYNAQLSSANLKAEAQAALQQAAAPAAGGPHATAAASGGAAAPAAPG